MESNTRPLHTKNNNYFADGKWNDRTTFVNIVVWGTQGANFFNSVNKGTRIIFTGTLDVRSYVPSGGVTGLDLSYFTEIKVSEVGLALKFATGYSTPNNVSPDFDKEGLASIEGETWGEISDDYYL